MIWRRSSGHYSRSNSDKSRATYASASAAAATSFRRQMGPSAAAAALRHQSMDQSDAAAMRDFQMNSPSQPPRRANSMSASAGRPTRSYQVIHHPVEPVRRASRPSSRANSLSSINSGQRANSLTETHTIVKKDMSGRKISITTTTDRHLGYFEVTSTKNTPYTNVHTDGIYIPRHH